VPPHSSALNNTYRHGVVELEANRKVRRIGHMLCAEQMSIRGVLHLYQVHFSQRLKAQADDHSQRNQDRCNSSSSSDAVLCGTRIQPHTVRMASLCF
jgi:hypothetical protein